MIVLAASERENHMAHYRNCQYDNDSRRHFYHAVDKDARGDDVLGVDIA